MSIDRRGRLQLTLAWGVDGLYRISLSNQRENLSPSTLDWLEFLFDLEFHMFDHFGRSGAEILGRYFFLPPRRGPEGPREPPFGRDRSARLLSSRVFRVRVVVLQRLVQWLCVLSHGFNTHVGSQNGWPGLPPGEHFDVFLLIWGQAARDRPQRPNETVQNVRRGA